MLRIEPPLTACDSLHVSSEQHEIPAERKHLTCAAISSILAPVQRSAARLHRKMLMIRRPTRMGRGSMGNEDRRHDEAQCVKPKRAITIESVDCTWGKSLSRWIALRMTRCRFLPAKGPQSFFLPIGSPR